MPTYSNRCHVHVVLRSTLVRLEPLEECDAISSALPAPKGNKKLSLLQLGFGLGEPDDVSRMVGVSYPWPNQGRGRLECPTLRWSSPFCFRPSASPRKPTQASRLLSSFSLHQANPVPCDSPQSAVLFPP